MVAKRQVHGIQRFLPIALAVALHAAIPATLGAESLSGELPHVAITGFANLTGESAFDIPSETAADSLILTLKLLGTYRVVVPGELSALPTPLTDATLAPWCESNGYDYCIYGSITRGSGGAQKYQLKVFDRAKGKTTITETAKGESPLDVFSVSDDLAGAVIDSVTGYHVGYGSVNFLVQGPIEDCVAHLDGIDVGSTLNSLYRIVTGTHRLVVGRKDAKGSAPVVDREFEVVEGQDVRIDVIIPVADLAAKDQDWIAFDSRKDHGASTCTLVERTELVNGTECLARVVTGRLVRYRSTAGVVMKPGKDEIERLRSANGISLRMKGDAQPYMVIIETEDNYYLRWIYPSKKAETLRIDFHELEQGFRRPDRPFSAKLITGISIEPANRTAPYAPAPISFTFTVYDLGYY